MTTEQKTKKVMPKGGRTGGAIFPRTSLKEALTYASKLVSKTHTGPQSYDIMLSAVVGSKTSVGRIRMSSLKQFGLLKGDIKSKFDASELAKQIVAAPQEEVVSLYRKAVLQPTIFRKLFETFHSDTYSKSKIKQRAAELNVHPNQTESCVSLYIAGMETARLVTVDGDKVTHTGLSEANSKGALIGESDVSGAGDQSAIDADADTFDEGLESGGGNASEIDANTIRLRQGISPLVSAPKAIFNVNVTLDSSLDIDKLRQHLELLKQFGAI